MTISFSMPMYDDYTGDYIDDVDVIANVTTDSREITYIDREVDGFLLGCIEEKIEEMAAELLAG